MHNGVRGVIVLGRSGYGGFMAGIFWERQGHRMSGEGYSCFLGGVGRKKMWCKK